MKDKTKPTLTLDLTEEEKFRLRLLALQFGLYIGRGPMADFGSIQKLIKSIANGNLKIIDATGQSITIISSGTGDKNIVFMPNVATRNFE